MPYRLFALSSLLLCLCLGACSVKNKQPNRDYVTTKPVPPHIPTGGVTEVFPDLQQSTRFALLTQAVRFDAGSSKLSPSTRRALDGIAKEIQRSDPSFEKIRIFGRSDATGNSEENLRISQERADNVRDYLISKGIPEDKLESVGKGPAALNTAATAAQHARDRRVDFEVVE